MRIRKHPILDIDETRKEIEFFLDGEPLKGLEGETIAAALLANDIHDFRYNKLSKPRSIYCAIGRCTDCIMIVDGVPNVRTCVTELKAGMRVQRQLGLGQWKDTE